MKVIACGLAALLISTVGAYAMDPVLESVIGGGKVYTDPNGMTLYTSDKDGIGMTTCYAECAKTWVPFAAATGATSHDNEWTVVDRTDGTKMWAHHGKPLYTYVEDKKPGDTLGNGKSPDWHIATPD